MMDDLLSSKFGSKTPKQSHLSGDVILCVCVAHCRRGAHCAVGSISFNVE
jgi:hypothetical protein